MQTINPDITWFPNSWIRLRMNGRIIYFDPAYIKTYFTNYQDKTEFSSWPGPIDGLPIGLEKADYIFITHHHKDHCKKVTVDRLRKKETEIFAPKSCLKELGDRFKIVKPHDIIKIENDIQLVVVNAYNKKHGSSTIKKHKREMCVAYILSIFGLKFYHLGDTDYLNEMKSFIDIDVAFVPMGGKYTMNIDEAIRATLAIHSKLVIPIHNLSQNFSEFQNELISNGTDIRCKIPKIGEIIKIE